MPAVARSPGTSLKVQRDDNLRPKNRPLHHRRDEASGTPERLTLNLRMDCCCRQLLLDSETIHDGS
jgi:hypothetical protein